jgi:hypothetical protein
MSISREMRNQQVAPTCGAGRTHNSAADKLRRARETAA